ncbi:UPF0249 protein ydjC homolog [Clonorchis sinensis]|uniref:Carbohydrate deacetylase n=1 Tax=Clonorchis sinensis TaxID=79923 RepID=G7YVB8_CLOSI|nr:UPF0249 protein ydjC homolog [Clonorchis sinensis]
MKYVIITADDGFYAETRDAGIVRCLQTDSGFGVTDVSVLMNGCVARLLIQLVPVARPESSVLFKQLQQSSLIPGLHINLTEGVPLTPVHQVHSLVNGDGLLLGKHDLRTCLTSGRGVDLEHLEREIETQLMSFRQLFDTPPIHVDGHQHVHVLPAIVPILCRLLPRHGVQWIRIPEELEDNFINTDSDLSEDQIDFFQTVSAEAALVRTQFMACGLRSTDAFIGMTLMGRHQTLDAVRQCLDRIDYGKSVEFMTHPGYALEKSLAAEAGCGCGGDDFACSTDREHEMEFLLDPTYGRLFYRGDYQRTSFAELSLGKCL